MGAGTQDRLHADGITATLCNLRWPDFQSQFYFTQGRFMFHTHSPCAVFAALMCMSKTAPFAFSIVSNSAKVSREPCSAGSPALTHLPQPSGKDCERDGNTRTPIPHGGGGMKMHTGASLKPPLLLSVKWPRRHRSGLSVGTTALTLGANAETCKCAEQTHLLQMPCGTIPRTFPMEENATTQRWVSNLSIFEAENMTVTKWGSLREGNCFRRSAESRRQDASASWLFPESSFPGSP